MRNRVCLALLLGTVINACSTPKESPARPRDASSEVLAPLEPAISETVLGDTRDLFVAEPTAVAISDRYIFVGDAGSSAVLQFSRAGTLVRKLGRRGRGPGELQAPTAIATAGDTIVTVVDAANGKLSVFGSSDGKFRYSKRLAGSPFSVAVAADIVLAATYNAKQQHSMFTIGLNDSVGAAVGPVSSEYRTGRRIKFTYPFSVAAFAPGGAVVAMVASPMLYRTQMNGVVLDSIVMGSSKRRGIPIALDDKLSAVKTPGDEMKLISVLLTMNSMDSLTYLVHFDFRPQGPSESGDAYLSVVDWRNHNQCLDATIPVVQDTRPTFGFRGDTLIVVQNKVSTADSMSSVTVVRLYPLPHCGVR